MIGWAVSTQYQRVTYGRTNRQSDRRPTYRPILSITCTVWLTRVNTRRMAIANGTWVSFCNQPKAHYLATLRESRRYVIEFSRFADACMIWLRQESLRHILASPGYAPGTIAVNVTWIERGFNAGQTHCSMYPSILNRLRAIARYWSEIATFSYPLHLTPQLGCSHWNSRKSLILRKLKS